MDKQLNSTCICSKHLYDVITEIVMIDPCEHLIHNICLNTNNTYECPYCYTKITHLVRLDDYKKDKNNKMLNQKCIDILAATNHTYLTYKKKEITIYDILNTIPNSINIIHDYIISYGVEDGRNMLSKVFKLNNTKIRVHGLNNINTNTKKVYISNHTSYMDSLVLFYILNTNFLASVNIVKHPVSKKYTDIVPLILIERGSSKNTTKRLKEEIDKNGSVLIFPQGIYSNPHTITKFRSGAFNLGYPIYPIIIKYKHNLPTVREFGYALSQFISNKNEEVDITFMKPYYPPFNENKIEKIRQDMAIQGDLLLSRISNRDLVD